MGLLATFTCFVTSLLSQQSVRCEPKVLFEIVANQYVIPTKVLLITIIFKPEPQKKCSSTPNLIRRKIYFNPKPKMSLNNSYYTDILNKNCLPNPNRNNQNPTGTVPDFAKKY